MTTDSLMSLLRGALLPTLAVGGLAIVASTVVAGMTGLVGAALGVVLVVAFFSASILVLRAARGVEPVMFLAVALTVFALKVLALALVLGVLMRTGWLDEVIHRGALGGTIIATALIWIAAETRSFVTMRAPIYDLDKPADPVGPGDEAAGERSPA